MAKRTKKPTAIAASQLPDLPSAGFATTRERQLTDAIMFFLRGAERDRLWLLSMVCDGKGKFRNVTRKAWRFMKADDEIIDAVFGYLELLAGEFPHLQRDQLLKMGQMSAVQKIRHITGLERVN